MEDEEEDEGKRRGEIGETLVRKEEEKGGKGIGQGGRGRRGRETWKWVTRVEKECAVRHGGKVRTLGKQANARRGKEGVNHG